MNADTEQERGVVPPPGVARPLRHRQPADEPGGEPTGDLMDADLAQPYLAAAWAAVDEPTYANYKAAEAAAHHLASRYTSWNLLTQGGGPRESRAGWALFDQARAYRTLAAQTDDPS